jgi:hypothetical protein
MSLLIGVFFEGLTVFYDRWDGAEIFEAHDFDGERGKHFLYFYELALVPRGENNRSIQFQCHSSPTYLKGFKPAKKQAGKCQILKGMLLAP